MPSLIIPETKTKFIYPDTQQTSDFNTWKTLQGCITWYDTEDVEDGEEIISRGEHLKRFLFDGKHSDLISFDRVYQSASSAYWSCGMFFDAVNTDNILAIYSSNAYNGYTGGDFIKNLKDYSGRSNPYQFLNDYMLQYANNAGSAFTRLCVKNFDSFVVFMYTYFVANRLISVASSQWAVIYEVYDIENHEIVTFDPTLTYFLLSAPGARSYARPLTIDGCNGGIAYPAFRKSSIEEVSYAPLTRIDGEEATRFYILSEFPEGSAWETLHVGDKYILVLPYDTSTSSGNWGSGGHEMHCAIGIDVTEDIENQ